MLRGDHGQQGGWEAIEFDMQLEHRSPWTRLLVPTRLVPDARRLRTNAERLISPFDLHATLLALLRRGAAQPEPPAGASSSSLKGATGALRW